MHEQNQREKEEEEEESSSEKEEEKEEREGEPPQPPPPQQASERAGEGEEQSRRFEEDNAAEEQSAGPTQPQRPLLLPSPRPRICGHQPGNLFSADPVLATGRSCFYSVPFCCRQILCDSLPIIGCFGTFLVCRSVVVLASSLRDFHQIHEGSRCARRAIKAAALGGAIKGCACTC